MIHTNSKHQSISDPVMFRKFLIAKQRSDGITTLLYWEYGVIPNFPDRQQSVTRCVQMLFIRINRAKSRLNLPGKEIVKTITPSIS